MHTTTQTNETFSLSYITYDKINQTSCQSKELEKEIHDLDVRQHDDFCRRAFSQISIYKEKRPIDTMSYFTTATYRILTAKLIEYEQLFGLF